MTARHRVIKVDIMEVKNTFSLVISLVMLGIVRIVDSQSVPESLFTRGCRANRGQFPHETFCQQYYNCWDGRATIEECPGKLLFNPVISACDYPEAVNCGAKLRNPEPSVTSDGRCLKQFGIFPDQTDCRAFYECAHGRAFRQVCPYYTAFDDRYLVCVHAYDVECGGRGGVYGTLAPPIFVPDGGTSAQIGLPPSGSAGSSSGWDRRSPNQGSASASGSASGPLSPPPIKGTRRVGPVGGPVRGGMGSGTTGRTVGSGTRTGSRSGSHTGGGSGSHTGGGSAAGSGTGAESLPSSGAGAGNRGGSGSGSTSAAGGTGSSRSSGRRVGSGSRSGSEVETNHSSVSSGTHAGLTGIVDKDISATGQERQYERPISPEATFRCPHPRGLYAYALDCSRFWLCREYKPSLLKCPTGQLFDLASLTCTKPEKAQCSSISPRT